MTHEDKDKNLRVVFEQYWLHARHVENERLWFTNIYAIVWAGSLALMSEYGFEIQVAIFLFALSFLGFFMCHALRVPFIKYSRMAEIIMREEWQLMKYSFFYPRESKNKNKKYGGGEVKKSISLNAIFYLFYMLGIISSSIIIIQETDWGFNVKIMVGVVILIIVVVIGIWFIVIENRLYKELGSISRKES